MNDTDLHAIGAQPIGGFQPQQAAADNDGAFMCAAGRQHLLHIQHIAEGHHAGQIGARNRQHERVRSGGDQQTVIFGPDATSADYLTRLAINEFDLRAHMQDNAIVRIPVAAIDNDVLKTLFPGQQGRQHDAIVIYIGFSPEHGDVVDTRRGFEQALPLPACPPCRYR